MVDQPLRRVLHLHRELRLLLSWRSQAWDEPKAIPGNLSIFLISFLTDRKIIIGNILILDIF